MPKHIDEDSSSEESSEEETHSIAEPEQDQEPNTPPPSFPSLGVFSWLLLEGKTQESRYTSNRSYMQ